jgi:uncharacterized protein (DUF302 family)
MSVEGLLSLRSSFEHAETMTRAETAVRANGMTVYARIDHAPAAAEFGTWLWPSVVLFFGSARVCAPLVEAVPSIAIDLPLRMLVWYDLADVVWLSYNDPRWLAERHRLGRHIESVLASVCVAMELVARMATSPS